jgi:putative transposase
MPRPSRQAVLGDGPACVHLVARFHNGEFLLRDPRIKAYLTSLLLDYKKRFTISIHHYCLMDSHIHLLVSFESTQNLSRFMHGVFYRLAQRINKAFNRRGHVFLDRAKTPAIQSGRRTLLTMRYLDLNPVRAGMVEKAHHYQWSSYRYYAFGEPDELIDPAPDYQGLSRVPAIRRRQYQELVSALSGAGGMKLPEMDSWHYIGDRDWVLKKLRAGGFLARTRPPG